MGEGLQRAFNAAGETRRRTTGKPSKPWRVYGARGLSTDYGSQRGAYEAVSSLTKGGTRATVYQWIDGVWVLYEVIEPDAEAGR